MATAFQFRAVASDGKIRTGTLSANTDKLAAAELRRQGLIPVYVGLDQKKSGIELRLPSFDRGKRKDVLFFTQEISTLLNAGVPLDRAIGITAELTERAGFRLLILDVLRILKGGKSLADSLAAHPSHFPELYVNMVRAGEASGSLSQIFERLAEFERTRDDLRGYIVSSLIYPALLTCVGIGSIFILLNFVVPRFAQIFSDPRMKIPTPTLMMIEASHVLQTWWIPGVVALAAIVVAFYSYIRTRPGRLWWDAARLKLPLLGDALRKAETARFARAMGTLVASSVPLVQSIGISRGILNNRRMAGSLEGVSEGVKRGEGIAAPLRKTGEFPPLASHLLSVGEETGRLDAMFNRMADIYENETRSAIRRFTSLFEPLIILVMGIVIGSLILSLLLAITSINDVNL
ncbi:MAG: type II secretion system F family protein [Bryobacterales bacterium]|nr:type II secretion system F family protein [Bryobacterales bacterium]MBV9397149.1 type II secretion system F family protein [Bryobacterales bacterium]